LPHGGPARSIETEVSRHPPHGEFQELLVYQTDIFSRLKIR
jgi:hypothetical protein